MNSMNIQWSNSGRKDFQLVIRQGQLATEPQASGSTLAPPMSAQKPMDHTTRRPSWSNGYYKPVPQQPLPMNQQPCEDSNGSISIQAQGAYMVDIRESCPPPVEPLDPSSCASCYDGCTTCNVSRESPPPSSHWPDIQQWASNLPNPETSYIYQQPPPPSQPIPMQTHAPTWKSDSHAGPVNTPVGPDVRDRGKPEGVHATNVEGDQALCAFKASGTLAELDIVLAPAGIQLMHFSPLEIARPHVKHYFDSFIGPMTLAIRVTNLAYRRPRNSRSRTIQQVYEQLLDALDFKNVVNLRVSVPQPMPSTNFSHRPVNKRLFPNLQTLEWKGCYQAVLFPWHARAPVPYGQLRELILDAPLTNQTCLDIVKKCTKVQKLSLHLPTDHISGQGRTGSQNSEYVDTGSDMYVDKIILKELTSLTIASSTSVNSLLVHIRGKANMFSWTLNLAEAAREALLSLSDILPADDLKINTINLGWSNDSKRFKKLFSGLFPYTTVRSKR